MEEAAVRFIVKGIPLLLVALAWVVTNPREKEVAFLSKGAGRFVFALGLALLVTGLAVGAPFLPSSDPEENCIGSVYKVVGFLLAFYGRAGTRFKLVEIPR